MATATATENELLELEKQFWRALQKNDVDAAMRLTDFPCIITGPQGLGRVDEQAFAKMMKEPTYTIDSFKLSDDAQVRMIKDDVAVVAYEVHEELTVEGKRVKLDASDSSTWIKRNGRWTCAHHTEAILGDPFGRDRQTAPAKSTDTKGASEDERAIRRMIDSWMEASQEGDFEKLLPMMTDDVVFMVPGREPFGKEAFAKDARAGKGGRMEGTAEIKELQVLGDWAFCRTHLEIKYTPASGETQNRSGYTLSVLRKKPDGSWALARDANLLAPVE